jgi:hypothetical protein
MDWVTHNFGTLAFVELFAKALETHRDLGMKMDFAIGPNQGQGVPARSDDEGLQWDLVSNRRIGFMRSGTDNHDRFRLSPTAQATPVRTVQCQAGGLEN